MYKYSKQNHKKRRIFIQIYSFGMIQNSEKENRDLVEDFHQYYVEITQNWEIQKKWEKWHLWT